ncbi:MAG: hypothetical protein JO036_06280 [Candidatus Eremiobacteraeota bacterium]|nr:hypothetical protein [Candidatus Eremiobacteraeota bacterium]
MPWLLRRIYPYYVPSFLRDRLQRELTAVLTILRARTRNYDDETWTRLSDALQRVHPVCGFADFIAIIRFDVSIAEVSFPVRSSSSGAVRCGRGWGGFVSLEKIGLRLGEIDHYLEQRRQFGQDA